MAVALAAALVLVVVLAGGGWVALIVAGAGTPDAATRGTGHDALWLGHAWVDGRETPSDVDELARRLRGTGIHDLFVHAGPLRDDGSLDAALIPRARWLTGALHTALPGVRVQAWLGAHPVPGALRLGDAATRERVLDAASQALDDGFDGVHYDFEPVRDGDPDLVRLLAATHRLTRARHATLSLSASVVAPVPGLAAAVGALPHPYAVWSSGYLHRLAVQVDQVALMAYDTGLWPAAAYTGYVRRATTLALRAVPSGVALFIGVPAYQEHSVRHHGGAETVRAALRGVRLALGASPPVRAFGVALYVDFTATAADWATYRTDWAGAA